MSLDQYSLTLTKNFLDQSLNTHKEIKYKVRKVTFPKFDGSDKITTHTVTKIKYFHHLESHNRRRPPPVCNTPFRRGNT
jgi:hypothetical protein